MLKLPKNEMLKNGYHDTYKHITVYVRILLRWGEWKNNFHSAFRMPHSGKFPFRIRELFGTTVLTVGAIIHSECRILEKIHSALFHSPQRRYCL